MPRNSRIVLALVLTLGCAESEPLPESFDPGAPFPTYRVTGGWITGELDGRPFTSVEIDAHAFPSHRFPDCATQRVRLSIDALDGARGIRVYGKLQFFEGDPLRTDAPVLVGPDWGSVTPYQPPEGSVLADLHVDVAEREFEGDPVVDPNIRVVEVCQAPAGPCHIRLEIEGHFRFDGVNELAGSYRDATLSIGIDLERTIVSLDERDGLVLWPTQSCPSPSSDAGLRD